MYTYCDKHIIAGIISFSNPVKVEMYSHTISVLFFFHQTYQWLMDFYSFLHPHTDSPEEKLNLVGNKAILIRTLSLRHYLPIIPHAVNPVHIYLYIFHSFSVFIAQNSKSNEVRQVAKEFNLSINSFTRIL